MAKFTLNVNGVPRTLEADPDMPLLWVLRDRLALMGTKYGCGIGQCGAWQLLPLWYLHPHSSRYSQGCAILQCCTTCKRRWRRC